MKCTECQDFVHSYLGDELDEQVQADIESHLAGCPDCGHKVGNWQTCLSWLQRTFPEQAPPAELWEKIQAKMESK